MKNIADRADKKQHVLFPFIGLFIVIALVLRGFVNLPPPLIIRHQPLAATPKRPRPRQLIQSQLVKSPAKLLPWEQAPSQVARTLQMGYTMSQRLAAKAAI